MGLVPPVKEIERQRGILLFARFRRSVWPGRVSVTTVGSRAVIPSIVKQSPSPWIKVSVPPTSLVIRISVVFPPRTVAPIRNAPSARMPSNCSSRQRDGI